MDRFQLSTKNNGIPGKLPKKRPEDRLNEALQSTKRR